MAKCIYCINKVKKEGSKCRSCAAKGERPKKGPKQTLDSKWLVRGLK